LKSENTLGHDFPPGMRWIADDLLLEQGWSDFIAGYFPGREAILTRVYKNCQLGQKALALSPERAITLRIADCPL
jgi:hypothetical protein